MDRKIAVLFLCALLFPTLGFAQSTANQVLPGLLVSSPCPPGYTYCYAPYSNTNPLPVSGTFSSSVISVTTTDKSGTLTLGGTAQAAIALNASRKGWCIQNPASASEDLFVRVNGTASATTGTDLSPGQAVCSSPSMVDTAAVSVFAATTSHAYLGFEVQ